MERLTDGLWYERETASASVVRVRRRASDATEPMLRVRRGAMNGRRVHIDLVLLGGGRSVEVSFHPAATVDLVRGHAQRRGFDANGWVGALLPAVGDDAARWGSWTPAEPASSPLAVLGGVTHPLLGAAYDAGVVPVAEIPRWASAALAEPTMAACVVRLLGAPAASRVVVRSLATVLVRPEIAWWQLAVAASMTSVCAADDVAAALAVSLPSAPSASRLPTAEDLAVLRAGLAILEPRRAKRLVLDALVEAGERGSQRLAVALRALVDVKDDVRWPVPVRLADLEAVCLRATAVDPAPPPPARPRPAVPVSDELAPPVRQTATATAGHRPGWTTPRRAPVTTGGAPSADQAFAHPREARALDGCTLAGELELVLPRTAGELRVWGRMLGNCLADFGAAVAEHRSVILGVKQRGSLVAAVELVPDLRDVRQFLGPRNRVPPATVVDPVLARLRLRPRPATLAPPSCPAGRR